MRALILSGGRISQGPSLLSDKRTYVATDGQTVFEVNYEGANVDVYVNGFRLAPDDYEAAGGASVSLDLPCAAGDIVTLSGGASGVSVDSYSKAEMNAALAGKAASSHTHATSQVTGLDTALAGKAALRATRTVDGGVRMYLSGTTLYITNNGNNA